MMTTVGDYRLGVQAWVGTSEPDPNKITVSSTRIPRWKPLNGFFTSTWDLDRQSCAWLELMQTRGQRNLAQEGRSVWTFEPDPGITLRVIDSHDDYREFANEHPHHYENERIPCLPNWYGIYTMERRPFDAVHVTAKAAGVLREWGVESTAWFALQRFPDVQRVAPVDERGNLV